MLLTVTNLITEFRNHDSSFKAIDVSFEIGDREIVGLVGESGSGKTITALSLVRILSRGQFSTGSILFNNETVDLMKITDVQMAGYRGKEIGFIFQEPVSALNPIVSCGKQLTEAILIHQKISEKKARAKAIELLKKVDLLNTEDVFNSYPFQLSAGQKQRVLIAIAICCNPRLLIADEPTTALDTITQQSILVLLKKLQLDLGMSILYITHDLDIVSAIAQRVLVISKGSIVESGTVQEVYLNPKNDYTKELMSIHSAKYKKGLRLPVLCGVISKPAIGVTSNKNTSILYNANEMQVLLKVSNLSCAFRNTKLSFFGKNKTVVKAVDGVSFELRVGETLGIIGLSGCGKTTIARSIIRMVEPLKGTIQFKEDEVTNMDKFDLRDFRKRVQLIFQDPYSSLNPKLKIGEALTEPMKVHGIFKNEGERKKQAMHLLSKVNINEDYFNRYPHELSGGERQRVVIARALTLNPELIICDECVSALDISAQATVLNLLNDLKHEFNLTYIFISHDLNVVNYMSDRILVMNSGKIIEEGTSEQLFSNSKTDLTKSLIAAIPKEILT